MWGKSLNECYTKFLGNGNADSDLWIIGFEPGGNPFGEKSSEYSKLHNALKTDNAGFIKYLNDELIEEKIEGNTYQYVAKIVEVFDRTECLDKINNTITFRKKGNAFYSNLFPLSFPQEKHQDNDIILKKYQNYFSDLISVERRLNYSKGLIQKRYEQTISPHLIDKKSLIILKLGYEDYYGKLLNTDFDDEFIVDRIQIKWAGGFSIWPIYKINNLKVGFLPNGRMQMNDLEKFLRKFKSA